MSIESWIDGIVQGFGGTYAEAFRNYGATSATDVSEFDPDDINAIAKMLEQSGAAPFHVKKITRQLRCASSALETPQPPPSKMSLQRRSGGDTDASEPSRPSVHRGGAPSDPDAGAAAASLSDGESSSSSSPGLSSASDESDSDDEEALFAGQEAKRRKAAKGKAHEKPAVAKRSKEREGKKRGKQLADAAAQGQSRLKAVLQPSDASKTTHTGVGGRSSLAVAHRGCRRHTSGLSARAKGTHCVKICAGSLGCECPEEAVIRCQGSRECACALAQLRLTLPYCQYTPDEIAQHSGGVGSCRCLQHTAC